MTCSIAESLNKGKDNVLTTLATAYGAKAVTSFTKTTIDNNTLAVSMQAPSAYFIQQGLNTNNILKTNSRFLSSAVADFTSLSGITENDKKLFFNRARTSENALLIATQHYKSKKNILSAINSEENLGVIEINKGHILEDTAGRAFTTLTQEDYDLMLRKVKKQFKQEDFDTDRAYTEAVEKEVNKLIRAIILSGLYRGYTIVTEFPLDQKTVKEAIASYQRHFNQSERHVVYGSQYQSNIKNNDIGPRVIRFNSLESYMNSYKTTSKKASSQRVFKRFKGLNSYVKDTNLKGYDRFKKAPIHSKVYIAEKIIDVFEKITPGLVTEVLTNQDITQRYGKTFAGKAGFIVDNRIILNVDKFNVDTLFHEFGHFYINWLELNNKELFTGFMDHIGTVYAKQVAFITEQYANTGIAFSPTDILKEVFVTKMGMNAAQKLENQLSKLDKSTLRESSDITDLNSEQIFKKWSEGDLDVTRLEQEIIVEPAITEEEMLGRVGATVTKFAEEFVQNLMGVSAAVKADFTITGLTTVGTLIDKALLNSSLDTGIFKLEEINEALEQFKAFSFQQASAEDIYTGAVNRGLIKQHNGKIILQDVHGNRLDRHGNMLEDETELDLRVDDKNLLDKIDLFLEKNKNIALVNFSVANAPASVLDILNNQEQGLTLDETDGKHIYLRNSEEIKSVTTYVGDTFGTSFDAEVYIKKTIYEKRYAEYLEQFQNEFDALPAEEQSAVKKGNTAIRAAAKAITYIESNSETYRLEKEEITELFRFKTESGSFQHNLAELLILAVNISQQADYRTNQKSGERSYTYFLDNIIDKMFEGDAAQREEYFNTYFVNHPAITNEIRATRQYKSLISGFENIFKSMTTGTHFMYARDYLIQLKGVLKTVYSNHKGPITLIPELKLSNAEMGLAGMIDLLVIDRDGVAFVYDYKTKTAGKYQYWDFNSGFTYNKELAAVSQNAKNAASIQTSVYSLMLNKLRITTGASKVFYVENSIEKTGVYDKPLHRINKIREENLRNFTTELTQHFITQEMMTPEINGANDVNSDIIKTINKASGNTSIDEIRNVRKYATDKYDRSLAGAKKRLEYNKIYKSEVNEWAAAMGYKTFDEDALSPGLRSGKIIVRFIGGGKIAIPARLSGNREGSIDWIVTQLEKRTYVSMLDNALEDQFMANAANMKGKEISNKNTGEGGTAMRALVNGTNPDEWEFIKFSSNVSYGQDMAGITMIRHKRTGETKVVVLNYDKEESLDFSQAKGRKPGESRNSIYGNYVSDNIASTIHAHKKRPPATNYAMRLMKATLLIVRMKQLDPSFEVSSIVTNGSFKENRSVRIIDMHKALYDTKNLLLLMQKAGDLDPSMAEMLDPIKYNNAWDFNNYVPDPIKYIGQYINDALIDTNVERFLMDKSRGKKRTTQVIKKAREVRTLALDYGNLTERRHEDLLTSLRELRASLHEGHLRTDKAKLGSTLWKMTDMAIMQLSGMSPYLSPVNSTFGNNFLMTTSRASNAYMSALNRTITTHTTLLRQDHSAFMREVGKHMEKLAELNGVSLSGMNKALTPSLKKRLFSNLYIDAGNKDTNTAFTLKKVTDSSLRPAEKAFLKFFKESAQKYADMSIHSKVVVHDGWMPLIPKSSLSRLSDNGHIVSMRNNLYNIKNFFKPEMGDNLEAPPASTSFEITNRLANQFTNEHETVDTGFTAERRSLLGKNQRGEETSEGPRLERFEDNLENILSAISLSALDAFHYRDVTEVSKAMFYTIRRHEEYTETNLNSLKQTIELIQTTVINKQFGQEVAGGILGASSRLATQLAIAGTAGQMFLEMFTQPGVTAAKAAEEWLYANLFKGKREFSMKSFARAYGIMHTPGHSKAREVIVAIDTLYGFTNSDLSNLADKAKTLEGSYIFQSDTFMAGTKFVMETWQKITLAAYMMENGSFDAHSIDAEGNLVYDESKDERFKINTGSEKKNVENQKVYLATKEQLDKERKGLILLGGEEQKRRNVPGLPVDPFANKKMLKGFTSYDMNYLKEMLVEMYSSLDLSSKSLVTSIPWSKPITKMRTWMFAKIPRYFQLHKTASENMSGARLTKLDDSSAAYGYTVRYEGQATEGIVITMNSVMRQLYEYKSIAKVNENLNEDQKRNLAKLISDIGMFTIMMAAGYGFLHWLGDDDEEIDPMQQLAGERLMMAAGDVFFIYGMIDSVMSGSTFILFNILTRATESLFNVATTGAAYAFSPEPPTADQLAEASRKGLEIYGPMRTGTMIYDAFNKDS